ncbi:hypothetical protein C3E97_028100 [Pseudomonas sp. MWU12-2115]|uniref:hypothetical protein n=1 Tax=unclassified Pseudomonas TaxID=196821 RepID=UPI000CD52869|nr:hypothetical protein [Pseudomonas sp. MWU12-2020]RBB97326.1 hypothetical protein C3E97_028100 [Pseudomonas sp. MWU12-2115]
MNRYLSFIALVAIAVVAIYGASMVTFFYAPLSKRWFDWVSIGGLWFVAAAASRAVYVACLATSKLFKEG